MEFIDVNLWWFLLGVVVFTIGLFTCQFAVAVTEKLVWAIPCIPCMIGAWVCWILFVVSLLINLVQYAIQSMQ